MGVAGFPRTDIAFTMLCRKWCMTLLADRTLQTKPEEAIQTGGITGRRTRRGIRSRTRREKEEEDLLSTSGCLKGYCSSDPAIIWDAVLLQLLQPASQGRASHILQDTCWAFLCAWQNSIRARSDTWCSPMLLHQFARHQSCIGILVVQTAITIIRNKHRFIHHDFDVIFSSTLFFAVTFS